MAPGLTLPRPVPAAEPSPPAPRCTAATLETFIEASSEARTLAELIERFRTAVRELGCEHFAIAYLGDAVAGRGSSGDPPQLLALDYPGSWVERYMEQGFSALDPVLRSAHHNVTPYAWSELRSLTPQEQHLMGEASEMGLRHGISVPIHEPRGRVFLTSFTGTPRAPDARRIAPLLHMLSVQMHVRFRELEDCRQLKLAVRLTSRERECLLWSARGKSSWDTSKLIGISEHTVNFHLKNAMNKLGTASRVSAVAKCVEMGLIVP